MDKKKQNVCMLALVAFAGVITVLTNAFADVYILSAIHTVLVPLAVLAALVFGYFVFRDTVSYANKWIWVTVAIQAGTALKHLGAAVFHIAKPDSSVLLILALLVSAAGSAVVVTALVNNKFAKYLPHVLGVLALAALLRAVVAEFSLVSVLHVLVYAAFAVIVCNVRPNANKLLRVLAVVLAVISVSVMGQFAVIGWIVFAFVLVPAEKWNLRVTFAKIVAVLYILAAVLSLAAFAANEPFAALDANKNGASLLEEQISDAEKELEQKNTALLNYIDQLEEVRADLDAAEANQVDAEAALQKATEELQKADQLRAKVCSRDYYSSWSCDYKCRSQHNIVATRTAAVAEAEEAVYMCMDEVSYVQYLMGELEDTIQSTENRIPQLEKEIKSLTESLSNNHSHGVAQYFIAFMQVAALLFCIGGLICLAVCFFKENFGKNALIGCGALALGALVYLLLDSFGGAISAGYLLSSGYFWCMAVVGLLALIMVRKEEKLAKCRVLTIILCVVLAGLDTSAAGLVFAVAMICAVLVLVPPVFTEYNSIAKHIFFTIISLGIWNLIWIYHVTKNLNKVSGVMPRKPAGELLLSMFLPLYYSFWLLKTAEYVESYAAENGKQYKLDVICLVFAFICPVVSTVLIQNKINMIVGKAE